MIYILLIHTFFIIQSFASLNTLPPSVLIHHIYPHLSSADLKSLSRTSKIQRIIHSEFIHQIKTYPLLKSKGLLILSRDKLELLKIWANRFSLVNDISDIWTVLSTIPKIHLIPILNNLPSLYFKELLDQGYLNQLKSRYFTKPFEGFIDFTLCKGYYTGQLDKYGNANGYGYIRSANFDHNLYQGIWKNGKINGFGYQYYYSGRIRFAGKIYKGENDQE